MADFSVLSLLEKQFEPFFREEILPELDVPELFLLFYDLLDGSKISIEIHTDILRAIKNGDNLAEVVSKYHPQMDFFIPPREMLVWKTGNTSITVLPGSVRISVMFVVPSLHPSFNDRCLDLTIYTDDNRRYRELEFKVLWMSEDFLLVEYAECFKKGKFSSFDMRPRTLDANSREEREIIYREARRLLEGEMELVGSVSPTRYLGNVTALMEML
jgi:hypothetical protein